MAMFNSESKHNVKRTKQLCSLICEANQTDTLSTLEAMLDHAHAIVSDLAPKVTSLETKANLQD